MRLAWLPFAALLLPAAERPRRDYDVEHYRIQLGLDDRARSFEGETEITLRPLSDGFRRLELDAEAFSVRGVRDERGRLRFKQIPGRLSIDLRRAYRRGDRLSIRVSYVARSPRADPEKFGMPKGYDLGLTFKGATPERPATIRTLSFPEGARHWFPSNDHPSDKATADIVATVRSGHEVLSNGRLADVKRMGSRNTFHWKQEQPHSTYLFVLAAGPYVRVTDSAAGLPIGYWVHPGLENEAARSFGRTREIIRFFEDEYGVPFPWPKYDQIAIPDFGGGAESTSATVIGDGTLHDEKAEKDFPSHWLVAHEAAHQWWGDLVTMRDWTDAWINESFATYGEYLYSKHSMGEDEGALNMNDKRQQYLDEARTRFSRPISWDGWSRPNDNFNRHTYQKGAAVLHMLRWIMGDADFRRAMTHFLKKRGFQNASTEDLEVDIEEATGYPVRRFFDQWIRRAGHPVFDVRWQWLEGSRRVRLTVSQKQTPLFETPVEVGLVTEAGKRIERLHLGRLASEEFELECESRPKLVRFDEGNRLLMEMAFEKDVTELEYQLRHDDAMGRMWAASQLKGRGAEAALRRAAGKDTFWAVRRAAVEATEGDAAFFKERALDSKSDVRVAALRRLAAWRECEFLASRFRKEASYLAQAEAIRGLGRCGDKSLLPMVREAARMRSPGDVVKRAAEAALTPLSGGQVN